MCTSVSRIERKLEPRSRVKSSWPSFSAAESVRAFAQRLKS
jgi:hypothetical protein